MRHHRGKKEAADRYSKQGDYLDRGVGLGELLSMAADVVDEEHPGCLGVTLLRALQSLDLVLPQPVSLDPALVLWALQKSAKAAEPPPDLESLRRHEQRLTEKAEEFDQLLPVVRAASAPADSSAARRLSPPVKRQATGTTSRSLGVSSGGLSDATDGGHSQEIHPISSMTSRKISRVIETYVSAVQRMDKVPSRSHGGVLRRIYLTVDDPSASLASRLFAIVTMVTILVSTVSFAMESLPAFQERKPECAELLASGLRPTAEACRPQPVGAFWHVEAACIGIFTFDYVLRVATVGARCATVPAAVREALAYARQPLNIVDIVAIAPFWVKVALGEGKLPSVLSVLRLFRIFRVFKLGKHHRGLKMFTKVIMLCGRPLFILAFFNLMIIVLFASLMYLAEGQRFSVASQFTEAVFDACSNRTVPARFPTGVFVRRDKMGQKDVPTPYHSIPYCMWWVVVTLTTVGYGDYAPTTYTGKAIGAACFYMGVLFLALPITVLGHNFDIVYNFEHGGHGGPYRRSYRPTPSRQAVSPTATVSSFGRVRTSDSQKTFRRSLSLYNHPFGSAPWFPSCPGLRKKVFVFFEHPSASKLGKFMSLIIMFTIFAMTVLLVIESIPEFRVTSDKCEPGQLTVENCQPQPGKHFYIVEVVGISIFSVDYLARVLTVHAVAPEDCGLRGQFHKANASPFWITVMYSCQWLNIIDLLAITPFYGELITGSRGDGTGAALRVLRLVRLFRVLRVPKLNAGVVMFLRVLGDSVPALSILAFMTLVACLFFASCIVYAEGENYSVDYFQEEYPYGTYVRPTADGLDVEVSPFTSVVYAFWWFFTTATTVGYGDDYPTTTGGRLVGVLCTYSGIILLAMPVTIVGGNFGKHYAVWAAELEGSRARGTEPKDASSEAAAAPPFIWRQAAKFRDWLGHA